MKKLLITSLLGLFGFVGAFASATDYTFQGSLYGQTYTPSQLVLNEDLTINSSSFSYTLNDGQLMHNATFLDSNGATACDITYDDNSLSIFSDLTEGYCILSVGTYNVIGGGEGTFGSFIISTSDSGGDDSGGYNSGLFLPNGIDDLKPIIGGLESTMAEFVPYIAYIGLGIVIACIGFVAIRWLVNWVRAKIFDNF